MPSLETSKESRDEVAGDSDSLTSISSSLEHAENNLIIEIPAGMERGIDIFPVLSRKLTSILSRAGSMKNVEEIEATTETEEELDLDNEEKGQRYRLSPEDELKYGRFSKGWKNVFLLILALSSCQGPFSGTSYLPAVQEISEHFHTTGDVINITSAVYTCVNAFAPCIFNPIFDFYGKRPVFIICCVGLTLTSLGVALANSLAMFFVFRALSGLFSATFITIAGSTMGDIFQPTERAAALSWCLSGVLAATSIGPVIGGVIVTFVSWRYIFWFQTAFSGFMTVMGILFLKETGYNVKFIQWKEETGKKFKFVKINPFNVMTSLRVPTLALLGWTVVTLMFNMYSLLVPIRYVIDPRFGFETPILGALFYLPPGLGCFLSTFFAGRWADYTLKKWIKKRDGRLIPEDRLRSTYFWYGAVMPISILIYGWCIEKEKGGMAVPIIAMFCNGFAQTFIFASLNTYCVDSLPQLGSAALGSNYFIRYLGGALGSAVALPEFDSIGIGYSSTISAGLLVCGFATLWVCTEYGHGMRTKWLKAHGHDVFGK